LEEDSRLHVAVLIGVQDVPPALENPTGDPRDQPGLIRPVQ
jgi:hypothetical protein